MLPLSDAFAIVDQFDLRLRTETKDITDVLDHHLAEELRAQRPFPAFDHSAMDGYAMRANDTSEASEANPASLRLVGESKAGAPYSGAVAPGETVRIFTGAMMPRGANAVQMQEKVTASTHTIALTAAVEKGEHVRREAEDFATGACLLRPGARLGPGEISILANQGFTKAVLVYARPKVAILCTGSELREAGSALQPGQIINTNGPMLCAAVRNAGGIPIEVPPVGDEPEQIEAALRKALDADLVLTVGGVSVGDHDHIPAVLKRLGIKPHFHRVRVKPGKPLAFSSQGKTPILGLPGNPVSSFVMFELFARPMIRRLLGDPSPYPRMLRAICTSAVDRRPGRTEFVRASLHDEGGNLKATPTNRQGSGSLVSMVGVDGFIVIPHEQGPVGEGETVDIWPIRPLGLPIP